MPVPTGVVSVTINGNFLTNYTLDASGNYTGTYGSLGVGTWTIVAAYQGDGNFLPSTSTGVVEVVNPVQTKQATTTSLGVSPNPITIGDVITMSGGVVGS